MCCHGNGLILRGIIAPFLVYTGVYEHGNERGYSYGVSKYFPPVPRRRCRVLLYCGRSTAAIQPGELYEIIVLIQLEK
jgi:hypothetical protein